MSPIENHDEPLHILVVDDDATNILLIEKTLRSKHYHVSHASSGEEALTFVQQQPPDIILLDVMMPGMNGFEVCKILKSQQSTRLLPIIIITALQEKEDRIAGIEAGCDDFLSKPIDRLELVARVQALGKVKRLNDDLDHAEAVVMSFARAVEAKDGTTGDHCDRLIRLVTSFGNYIGLIPSDIRTLVRASVVHDVGKIGVPDSILLKPGKLTDEEWKVMKLHPLIGEEICRPLRSFKDVLRIIRHHHEKWNGSGYPDGLKTEEIPYLARIFQIIDAYDAMTTVRPYKKAYSTEEALALLREESKRGLWDPDILQQFIAFIEHHRGEFSLTS
ncbi:MAG: hypothetical protein A3I05_04370 [Deltaproteobacteria bacterium RIFCSPLOWO2_02_FULL_44_10]|nr:MAG: hypothetical protein A3C46_07180 [Deltaproteobacteria bacterium RIFCSPHIGHO2_02_FULL_44_16]OGQ46595.1 MAG: hypothetical protein A3I05_04370 [Deltaproteobacteria bacterium RIFCSPLOWO2_02_FULL_44_10]